MFFNIEKINNNEKNKLQMIARVRIIFETIK